MKRIITLLISFIMLITLCSCTQQKINSLSNELKSKEWEGKGEYMTTITLDFEEDNATVEIVAYGGAKNSISGLSIVSDSTITINDDKLKKNFTFTYTLQGNQLELEYDGQKIIMTAQ